MSDLESVPQQVDRWLHGANAWDAFTRLRDLNVHRDPDAFATACCARATSANKVYLYSRLDPDRVEGWSMVGVSGAREVENLMAKAASLFLLEDADRAHVVRGRECS